MNWLAPEWLWLLLPLAAAVIYRRRTGPQQWELRRFWLLLSALAVITALCRPVIPQKPVEIDVTGSDIIVAVDLSYSMQATDIAPTRLEAAKQLLKGLVEGNTHDRFGVIGFTTNAIVLSPLTNDSELLLHLFGGLDEKLVMTKGTELMDALKLARKMSRSEHPKLLLLTDGGDALNYNDEAYFAKESGLQVDVVMLASRGGSTLKKSDGSLLKDDAGHIVVSSRNDAVGAISRATDGAVIEGADLGALRELLETQKAKDYRGKTKIMQYQELFYYFTVAAILCFMLGVTTLGARAKRLFAGVLLLTGISGEAGVLNPYHLYSAQKAYGSGAYAEAAAEFGRVDSDAARYNAANSYYKAGKYEEALQLYRAIRTSDPEFKATLYYNIAAALIRLQEFEQARTALHKSLALRYDPDAVENLLAISRAEEQDRMMTGRQEGKKRAEQARGGSAPESGKKKKAGGSNMDVSAEAGGGSPGGKKVESDPRLSFSKSEGVTSSRQYELINRRSVHETKPW